MRWELDSINHTDCDALLQGLDDNSVDAIITDPPYGLAGRVFEHGSYKAVNEEWDHTVPVNWMNDAIRVLKPGGSVVCFGGRQSTYYIASIAFQLGWRLVNDITWYKPVVPPNFTGRMMTESTERALWFCPDGKGWKYNLETAKLMNRGVNLRDVWTFNTTRGDRLHPTQKPLPLMERLVALLTNENDVVVDPFCGSGTTAIAARNLRRRYICGDTSAEYVEVARQRIAAPYTPYMFAVDE